MVLFVLLGLVALPTATGSCVFSQLDFDIKEGHQEATLTAPDEIACGRRACGCRSEPCVFSFHPSGRCLSRAGPHMPLAWIKEPLPWINDSQSWLNATFPWIAQRKTEWVSFVSGAVDLPKALWPLSSVYGGRNLGSLGQRFNISAVDNVAWTGTGPLGQSIGKFARLDGSTNPRVVAQHDGKKLLDLSKPFTITMWVKTDDVTRSMPLLEGYEGSAISFAFWFFPSNTQNQLFAFQNATRYPYHQFLSTLDDTDRLEWRHLACVHDGQGSFSFYLNGNQWPVSERINSSHAISSLSEVLTMNIGFRSADIGFQNGGFVRFFGNMACIMIFEQALTADKIKSVAMCG